MNIRAKVSFDFLHNNLSEKDTKEMLELLDKLYPAYRGFEKEISPEDIFMAVVKDVPFHSEMEKYMGKTEYLGFKDLPSNFPSLEKLLSIPPRPDDVRFIISEPYLSSLAVQFGFFKNGFDNWAVMYDNRCYGDCKFMPVIGKSEFLNDKYIILESDHPGFKVDSDAHFEFKCGEIEVYFCEKDSCYPWIIEEPERAYGIGVLRALLSDKGNINPLSGLLTTRDGAVRTCANQVKNFAKDLLSVLEESKKLNF